DEKTGRRPDIMFVCMEDSKFYELMYTECFKITCTKRKEDDDDVKLWHESNDGMYWAHKSRRLEKEQFGIIGMQVAGSNTQYKINLLEKLNSKLQAENTEFRNENAKVKCENAKLRQALEGHETRITKLEQGEKSITNVLQSLVNSNDTSEQIVSRCSDIPESGITDNASNSNSAHKQIVIQNKNALASDNVSNSDIYQPICTESKSSEDKEMDDFLDSTYKEKVSKERIKKKILQQNLSSDNTSPEEVIPEVSVPLTSIFRNTELGKSEISAGSPCQNTHRKKDAEKIVQLISDGIQNNAQLGDKITPCDKILAGPPCQNSSTVPLLSLAQLFDKATDAEYGAIRANQEEILRWYYYGEGYLIQVRVVIQDSNSKIAKKKAKVIIYDKILEYLSILRKKRSEDTDLQLLEISRKCLQGKTQKAVKIYKLFETLDIDKIKPCQNSITDSPSLETSAPSFQSYTSNSEIMISEDNKSSLNTEISTSSVSSSNLTHDRIYFCNKTCSDGNDDYYGITDNTLCPLCKLDHGDDDIEGEYKNGTYYIKLRDIQCEKLNYFGNYINVNIDTQAWFDKVLTSEYLNWYSKLTDLPTTISDKLHFKLYTRYKKKTGLDPWMNAKTPESSQSENADNYLSQDCVIKISKFPEEKCTIHEAVHKRFPFLSYTNSNAWHRDVFKYTDSEAKCPVCKEKGIIAIQSSPEIQISISNKTQSPIPSINPNKIYQPETEKNRWAMGCFPADLERDIRFYRGGIERKEDTRKYHKFLTDRDRLVGEELLRRGILKSGLSTPEITGTKCLTS
ncbi:23837_t:CDS:2, partial [Gigaspora rosea]